MRKLYRITTKVGKGKWTQAEPHPFYVMARNRKEARSLLESKLRDGFEIDRISYLASENAAVIYSGGSGKEKEGKCSTE